MKSATKHIVISTILCALTLVVFLAFYNRLPASIPVHFDSAGVANSFWPRNVVVFGVPDVYKRQVLELLCSRFQEHPHLHVAVQYSIWFDHPKIHDAVERAKPRLHGLRCIQEQKEGKLLLQDGALLFKPKYAKKYARTMSQSQILSLSWELGVEDEEPDTCLLYTSLIL